ncbi:PilZ domain-containing protein [Shewanella youngdeokensis]|uniref:PilZ domain-containing protein n=1 Tax=Shewanella youngdeokensis TaxID=2999068 RepID=A0ABZ0K2N3_9GAMM|nr:PilZ domain-containing protein [Shewanella sp. DAU334]
MSIDLHNALIEQLKPLLMEPNFQELFTQLTAEETNSTRFLLKMELNRLSSDCTRVIDLRNKTELKCEEFTFGGQSHFIDAPSKANFLEALALYREQYTLGVYEQVINAHKARIQTVRTNAANVSETTIDPYIAQGIVLGSYFARSEERMNYSMKISVSQGGLEYIGITVDLSVNGARIRLPAKHSLNDQQAIKIKLLELSDEYYHQDLQQGVEYQIIDIEGNSEHSWLRVKRISGSEALAEMLAKLIRGYKFRYKVDTNDVLVTAKGLGFERHYLPHTPHLPLFVEDLNLDNIDETVSPKYQITHKLLGRDNQAISQYFKDESGVSQLNAMLTPSRLKALLTADEFSPHSQFFCFTFQANGGRYFYSASLAELEEKQLKALFFRFASAKPSWRVFHVAYQKVDHKQAYKASLLPGDDASYSSLTEVQLAAFTHVLQLIDVTNDKIKDQYQAWQASSDNVNGLKVFGQQKLKKHNLKQVSMQFSERRNEARFAFKTMVTLTQGEVTTNAYTQDISSRGLQLTTDTPIELNPKMPVGLSFPKLQTIAGKTNLQHLPYRLIQSRDKGGTMHLSAQIGHTPHVGVEFLNRLIDRNRDRFEKLTDNNEQTKELADGMKNLLMRKLVSVPFYLEKTVKSAYISAIGIGKEQNPIANTFATGNEAPLEYDLSPLFDEGKLKRDIIAPIRLMKPQTGLEFYEVYVQISRLSQGKVKVRGLTEFDLTERKQLLHFIQQSQQLGDFLTLRVYRGATAKPDLSYIRRELDYIRVHTQHKAKKLEEKLWHIIGVGELLDITQEVLLRFPELDGNS